MRTVTFPMSHAEYNALDLSYYTMCHLADVTRYVDPAPVCDRIHGTLTMDDLGNFLSFHATGETAARISR